ncbi:MAG: 4-(cytidine 5'-diphospho)-2-C-methyl-D-erythritol kinase [Cyanobacteria bacterium P01_D01_bin.123]
MRSCWLNAPGKINLYLEITGDRSDGYRSVVMVLQSIALADRVRVELGGRNIDVRCDRSDVPDGEQNLAYRAAALLAERYDQHAGVRIYIDKHIPVGAGLAGGSTDAAAVLVGLNQLWQLGLTAGDLQDLAAKLGSDIPFCIHGGTMLAIGRGEQLSPLQDLQSLWLLLAKPRDLSISTAWAYNTYARLPTATTHRPISQMLSAIAHQDTGAVARCLHNDLELAVLPAHPSIERLKQAMLASEDVLGAMMSGSGSTVFAILPTSERAMALRNRLQPGWADVDFWVTHTTAAGIVIEPDET